MAREIEERIASEDWVGARSLIRAELRRDPDSHWLLSRLALTYDEQRRYQVALNWARKALDRAPRCPLVLWDYAGTLDQLGHHREAVRGYSQLVRRGVNAIAYGPCGEGLRWARSLVADALFRRALAYAALGDRSRARRSLERHLEFRREGAKSIYPLREVRIDAHAIGPALRSVRSDRLSRSSSLTNR